jgi:hypothetical protein
MRLVGQYVNLEVLVKDPALLLQSLEKEGIKKLSTCVPAQVE